MHNPETTFLFARHTKKQKKHGEGSSISGNFYEAITPEGEELVREKTRQNMLEVIEDSEPGSVVIFVGASDLVRTKSTTEVSINELKKLLADKQDEYLVLDRQDIDNAVDPKNESRRQVLSKTVCENQDKKVILSYPLAMKEFSLIQPESGPNADKPDWKTGGKSEVFTPYLTELMKRANDQESEAVSIWIDSGGKFILDDGSVVEGPNPDQVAKDYINALKRLDNITKELFPNRPRIVEATTHSWDVDIFLAYATHNGKLDREAYEEIAKGVNDEPSIISEFEFPIIKVGGEKQTVTYRGKEWELNSPEFMKEQKQG